MIGWAPTSTSALGMACVCSRSLVPRPPQRIATGISTGSRLGATGNSGENGHLVAVGQVRVQPVLEPDVFAGHIDVHEAAQPVVGDQPLPKRLVLVEDGVKGFADGGTLHLQLGLAARDRAQLRRDLYGHEHRRESTATKRRSR